MLDMVFCFNFTKSFELIYGDRRLVMWYNWLIGGCLIGYALRGIKNENWFMSMFYFVLGFINIIIAIFYMAT